MRGRPDLVSGVPSVLWLVVIAVPLCFIVLTGGCTQVPVQLVAIGPPPTALPYRCSCTTSSAVGTCSAAWPPGSARKDG